MIKKIICIFFSICILTVTVFPLIYIFIGSLNGNGNSYRNLIWDTGYINSLFNSLVTAFSTSIIATIIAAVNGYVISLLSKIKQQIIQYILLILLVIPFEVTMLPLYKLVNHIGLYDNIFSVVFVNSFPVLSILYLYYAVQKIPHEVFEAVRLETSSTTVLICNIIVPNIKSGILCVWVINFANAWNDTTKPLVFLESLESLPTAVWLNLNTESSLFMAEVFCFTLLPLFLFIVFEDEIVDFFKKYVSI